MSHGARRFIKRVVAIVAVTALVGACSESSNQAQDNSEDILIDALNALAESEGLTVSMTLSSDAASLQALSESGGEPMTEEMAETILDSSITIRGTQVTENKGDGEFVVNLGGSDAVEVKVVDDALYARADVGYLLETFGEDTSRLQRFERRVGKQYDFIGPALDGEWLSLQNFSQFGEQFSGQGSTSGPLDQKKAIEDLTRALKQSSDVTTEGEDEVGTHLVVALNFRTFFGEVQSSLQLPGGAGLPFGGGLPSPSELPDEEMDVDVWVADGQIRQIAIDFTQFEGEPEEELPEGVEELALLVTFEEFAGEIEAPDDAIEIEPETITQVFSGMLFGKGPGTGPARVPAVDCRQFEDIPPEALEGLDETTKEQLDQLCPDLF